MNKTNPKSSRRRALATASNQRQVESSADEEYYKTVSRAFDQEINAREMKVTDAQREEIISSLIKKYPNTDDGRSAFPGYIVLLELITYHNNHPEFDIKKDKNPSPNSSPRSRLRAIKALLEDKSEKSEDNKEEEEAKQDKNLNQLSSDGRESMSNRYATKSNKPMETAAEKYYKTVSRVFDEEIDSREMKVTQQERQEIISRLIKHYPDNDNGNSTIQRSVVAFELLLYRNDHPNFHIAEVKRQKPFQLKMGNKEDRELGIAMMKLFENQRKRKLKEEKESIRKHLESDHNSESSTKETILLSSSSQEDLESLRPMTSPSHMDEEYEEEEEEEEENDENDYDDIEAYSDDDEEEEKMEREDDLLDVRSRESGVHYHISQYFDGEEEEEEENDNASLSVGEMVNNYHLKQSTVWSDNNDQKESEEQLDNSSEDDVSFISKSWKSYNPLDVPMKRQCSNLSEQSVKILYDPDEDLKTGFVAQSRYVPISSGVDSDINTTQKRKEKKPVVIDLVGDSDKSNDEESLILFFRENNNNNKKKFASAGFADDNADSDADVILLDFSSKKDKMNQKDSDLKDPRRRSQVYQDVWRSKANSISHGHTKESSESSLLGPRVYDTEAPLNKRPDNYFIISDDDIDENENDNMSSPSSQDIYMRKTSEMERYKRQQKQKFLKNNNGNRARIVRKH